VQATVRYIGPDSGSFEMVESDGEGGEARGDGAAYEEDEEEEEEGGEGEEGGGGGAVDLTTKAGRALATARAAARAARGGGAAITVQVSRAAGLPVVQTLGVQDPYVRSLATYYWR